MKQGKADMNQGKLKNQGVAKMDQTSNIFTHIPTTNHSQVSLASDQKFPINKQGT